MTTKRSLFAVGLAVLFCAGVAQAASGTDSGSSTAKRRPVQRWRDEGTFHLTALQFSGMYIWQNGGSSWTGEFAWTPQYNITSDFGVRANLGGSILKGMTSDHFTMLDYELLLNYTFITQWEIEAGGGAQTWIDHGGTRPAVSATYAFKPKEKLFTFVDSIFATYTHTFISDNAANQVRLGLAVGL